jgi:Tol biopolymer transport system component
MSVLAAVQRSLMSTGQHRSVEGTCMPRFLRGAKSQRPAVRIAMVLALLGFALDPLPARLSAQTVSIEGKVVFVRPGSISSEHCHGQACADLWVMNGDGSNKFNLTSTPDVNEGDPAWSPDGTRIVFTSDRDEVGGYTDIWVINGDGSRATNLTPTAAGSDNFHEYQPAWSPSGTQIVFVKDVPGEVISEQADLFVMDVEPATDDATNITRSDFSELDPAWSPDGLKIAFAGVRNSGFEIVTMDPDGRNELVLTGDGFEGDDRAPDWSPDSSKVVFMKQSQVGGCCEPWEIWGVNRDGSGDVNLTNDPSDDMGPSWSPDGAEITFTSNRDRTVDDPFRTDIYAIPAPAMLAASALAPSEIDVRRMTQDGESSSPDWANVPPDQLAPRVTNARPMAAATDVSRAANVTVTFSEAMRHASINAQTFQLFQKGSTTPIAATVTYNAATHRAMLNPTSPLPGKVFYRAVVSVGSRDLAGNNLDQNRTLEGRQPKVWFFTTGT